VGKALQNGGKVIAPEVSQEEAHKHNIMEIRKQTKNLKQFLTKELLGDTK